MKENHIFMIHTFWQMFMMNWWWNLCCCYVWTQMKWCQSHWRRARLLNLLWMVLNVTLIRASYIGLSQGWHWLHLHGYTLLVWKIRPSWLSYFIYYSYTLTPVFKKLHTPCVLLCKDFSHSTVKITKGVIF